MESEAIRQRGNEEFTKGNFSLAADLYSRAIEFRPDNHLLFGNRAICFLRLGKYKNALCDGKKATILRSNYPKVRGFRIVIE
ncbi:hypothetical protein GDO86_002717 [Hymenochirus boettgeri]|uniref:Uncharacterized protein n=1 Tax=Hymenochirus boettgeri TaxID=247094 RepID=A0A8T2K297_9PIPI|nr:hypothetical protein GDO86_002717 [Hymenochirus boettgeri]